MNLEHRLHHAARELRAVEIEAPPLAALSAPRRPTGIVSRVPALVMPVLFVLGGLAVIAGGGLGRTAGSPDATPAAASVGAAPVAAVPDDATATNRTADRRPLTALQEIALIASLRPASVAVDDDADAVVSHTAPMLSGPYR